MGRLYNIKEFENVASTSSAQTISILMPALFTLFMLLYVWKTESYIFLCNLLTVLLCFRLLLNDVAQKKKELQRKYDKLFEDLSQRHC